MFIVFGLLGALSNWLRGGNLERWWEPPKYWSWKAVNMALCFSAFFFAFGWKVSALITVGMAIGQSFGWGAELRYIVGADKNLEIRGKWGKCVTEPLNDKMGTLEAVWLSMTIRGAVWGACLGIPSLTLYPVIAGALFPVFYWAAFKVFEPRHAWGKAEIGFGFILWLSVVL